MKYRTQFNNGTDVSLECDTFEEALAWARGAIQIQPDLILEIHITSAHPLEAAGVSWANPVAVVTKESLASAKEPLANLKGHGGGDVRESSCNSEVFPFVPYLASRDGKDRWCLLHPTLECSGFTANTRGAIEAIAKAINTANTDPEVRVAGCLADDFLFRASPSRAAQLAREIANAKGESCCVLFAPTTPLTYVETVVRYLAVSGNLPHNLEIIIPQPKNKERI